jgi:3-oxoacyl-(acyl-carrier-protein) synthase
VLQAKGATGKSGLILASGNTYWSGYDLNRKRPANFPVFKPLALATTNIYAGRVAQHIGYTDYVSTDSTSCVCAYNATFLAKALLDANVLDRVLIIAVEDATSGDTIEFFSKYGGNISLKDEEEGKAPSAFDETNTGFRVGNGAGMFLLDKDNNGIAQIDGIAMAAEKWSSPIGQDPAGTGYLKALAQIDTKGVRIIKAHGTGTPSNNIAERVAIESTFDDFIATSYKPLIGHTMGANGAIELDLLVKDLRRGVLTGIRNRTTEDTKFISKDTIIKDKTAICLGSSMGNGYAALRVSV